MKLIKLKNFNGGNMANKFGGFGGGMPNMQNLMKQAQMMQEKVALAQEELENLELTASSGGGAVEIVITGQKVIRSIKIDPKVVDPDDVEMLEDLIIAACNEAFELAEKAHNEKMGPLTGGIF